MPETKSLRGTSCHGGSGPCGCIVKLTHYWHAACIRRGRGSARSHFRNPVRARLNSITYTGGEMMVPQRDTPRTGQILEWGWPRRREEKIYTADDVPRKAVSHLKGGVALVCPGE